MPQIIKSIPLQLDNLNDINDAYYCSLDGHPLLCRTGVHDVVRRLPSLKRPHRLIVHVYDTRNAPRRAMKVCVTDPGFIEVKRIGFRPTTIPVDPRVCTILADLAPDQKNVAVRFRVEYPDQEGRYPTTTE